MVEEVGTLGSWPAFGVDQKVLPYQNLVEARLADFPFLVDSPYLVDSPFLVGFPLFPGSPLAGDFLLPADVPPHAGFLFLAGLPFLDFPYLVDLLFQCFAQQYYIDCNLVLIAYIVGAVAFVMDS